MVRERERWRATLLLIGTIIGAGIFGVPAMIGAWGVPLATLGFVGVTLLVLAAHVLYAEAILRSPANGRIQSYATRWLGAPAGKIAGVVQSLQIFGSNLAYLILGGEFLAMFARAVGVDIPVLVWQIFFWILGSAIVISSLAAVSRIEAALTWGLVCTILVMTIAFAVRIDADTVARIGLSVPNGITFEPYGVFLFALIGLVPIPEVVELVGRRREDAIQAVVHATLASAALTYAFGVFGWLASGGALGRNTTELASYLPPVLSIVFPVAGFLAVITSYITNTYDIRNMFHLDYRFSNHLSWGLALGIPFALLLVTPRDFLGTIGLCGALFGAAIATIAVLMGSAAIRSGSRFRILGWLRHHKTSPWVSAMPLAVAMTFFLSSIAWVISMAL